MFMKFTKALKELNKKGGYICPQEGLRSSILFFNEIGILTRGDLKESGSVTNKHDAILGSMDFNRAWFRSDFPEYKVIFNELEETLPIPNNVKDLKPIVNAQLNNIMGVGYKEVLRQLNERVDNSPKGRLAWIFMQLMEVFLLSQVASDKKGKEKASVYKQKDEKVRSLVEFCEAHNFNIGADSSNRNMPHPVIFFDLPNCEQITICSSVAHGMKEWMGESWDGKRGSSFPKIERAILNNRILV